MANNNHNTQRPLDPQLGAALDKRLRVDAESELRLTNFNTLMDHMYEISDDPQGSEPSDYMTEQDVDTLGNFLLVAEDLGWSGFEDMNLRSSRAGNIPAWTSSSNTVKAGLTKALFFPKVYDDKKAYQFGVLGIHPTQPVAIFDDGLLRSLRGTELSKSKGIGWGKLPDPDILKQVTRRGKAPVIYGPGSLGDVLLSAVPIENLAGRR